MIYEHIQVDVCPYVTPLVPKQLTRGSKGLNSPYMCELRAYIGEKETL